MFGSTHYFGSRLLQPVPATSTLDYLTPLEYELGFRKLADLAA
jgi:hypothetical protein